MGWIIMGVILFVLLKNKGACGHRRRRSCGSSRRRHRDHSRTASETYRMQAEAEDMDRRMRIMERILDPRDEQLRRDIQGL